MVTAMEMGIVVDAVVVAAEDILGIVANVAGMGVGTVVKVVRIALLAGVAKFVEIARVVGVAEVVGIARVAGETEGYGVMRDSPSLEQDDRHMDFAYAWAQAVMATMPSVGVAPSVEVTSPVGVASSAEVAPSVGVVCLVAASEQSLCTCTPLAALPRSLVE